MFLSNNIAETVSDAAPGEEDKSSLRPACGEIDQGCGERGRWLVSDVIPHEPAVRQMLRRTFPKVDEDEVLQATYLRLMATAEVGHVRNAKYYFLMTAKSVVRDHARRDSIAGQEPMDPSETDHAADEPSIEQIIDSRQALRRFEKAMCELPPRQRRVVELRRLDGLNVRATAQAMSLSMSAVEKHQTQAMRRLAAIVGWPASENCADDEPAGKPARFAR